MAGRIRVLFIDIELRKNGGRIFNHEKRRRRMMDDGLAVQLSQN